MFRCGVFCIIVVLLAVATSIPTNSNDDNPVVIVDFNSGFEDNILQEPAESQELFSSVELTAIPTAQVEGIFHYRIGKRVSNDRIVSQHSDTHHWPSPQNVTFILQYPSKGQGAIVTFVDIIVNQSSKLGLAHVLAGGIGKRFITCIVESNSTYNFDYSAKIYGL